MNYWVFIWKKMCSIPNYSVDLDSEMSRGTKYLKACRWLEWSSLLSSDHQDKLSSHLSSLLFACSSFSSSSDCSIKVFYHETRLTIRYKMSQNLTTFWSDGQIDRLDRVKLIPPLVYRTWLFPVVQSYNDQSVRSRQEQTDRCQMLDSHNNKLIDLPEVWKTFRYIRIY